MQHPQFPSKKSETSSLPNVIRAIIVGYASTWRLLPWISENEIDWNYLGENPHPAAYDLILRNLDKAEWRHASGNPMWWPWLKAHPELIDDDYVAMNTHPDAFDYIIANRHRMRFPDTVIATNPIMIPWVKTQPFDLYTFLGLCRNVNAGASELLLANKEHINWCTLHYNPAPWALKLCEDNPDKYDPTLAANPAGFDLLVKYAERRGMPIEDFVARNLLSRNNDPRAIALLMQRPSCIRWEEFSKLPNAVPHLFNNKHKLDWETLFANPGIFELWTDPGLFALL